MNCPQCLNPVLLQDEVDIGVGVVTGPRYCGECGWSEADDYGDEWPGDFDGMDDFVDL